MKLAILSIPKGTKTISLDIMEAKIFETLTKLT